MKPKILFWLSNDHTHFCMSYYMQKSYDCDFDVSKWSKYPDPKSPYSINTTRITSYKPMVYIKILLWY